MPLQSGASESTMQSNPKEVYNKYKKTKKIGSSRPKNKKKALKQAIAIAYSKAKRSRK